MVGSVKCKSCPTIKAIAPLVPIVPNLRREMHRMWRSYGGWTFAFSDYTDVNLTRKVDDPEFAQALKVIDPAFYYDRLALIPKYPVYSSDDEFMMFDWSALWYPEIPGETHLLIAPNSEHSLATGIPTLTPSLANLVSSVGNGHGTKQRPSFEYAYNEEDGTLSVTIPKDAPVVKVALKHAFTLQSRRRDFRWVRAASEATGKCRLPEIPLLKPVFGGGNCIVPIVWKDTELEATEQDNNLVYSYTPAADTKKWLGYYILIQFESDTGLHAKYHMTTPGFIFPTEYPFEDCHGAGCEGTLL